MGAAGASENPASYSSRSFRSFSDEHAPELEKTNGGISSPDGDAISASKARVERQISAYALASPPPGSPRQYGLGHGDSDADDSPSIKDEETEEITDTSFEVQWDGEDDPMNPRHMSKIRKWVIVLILSAGSTCVTCTSSMYVETYDQLTSEFHVSRVVATLGLSLFVIGLGVGPMILAPLSEFYGKRSLTLSS